MDYIILTNRDSAMLAREVNATIKQGWEPLGGVTIEYTFIKRSPVYNDNSVYCIEKYFLQAMIKRDQEAK